MAFLPLQSGDTIGVFSPCSYVQEGTLEAGRNFLKAQGFQVYIHPQTYARHNQSAGTAAEKCAALCDLYTNPDIKAVIAASGGNRALHMIPGVDFGILKDHSKPLIGYSDATVLLNAMQVKTGHIQVHAPVLANLKDDDSGRALINFLKTGAIDYDCPTTKILNPGGAQGPVYGGNISMLHHMTGLDIMPDLHGAILLLEDVNEEMSRLDRTLCHFRQLGLFNKLSGLIFGSLLNLQDTGKRPFGFDLGEILTEHTAALDIPIVLNAPFGHGAQNYALPIGHRIKLSATINNVKICSN